MKFLKQTILLKILLIAILLTSNFSFKITNINNSNNYIKSFKFKESNNSFISLNNSNKLKVKGAADKGNYGGECIYGDGAPTCNDPRTRCADKNDERRCFIAAWQRCDKSTDFNTTCADLDFRCINYKILDSQKKEIAFCSLKGTYMDTCSSTNPCAQGFKCTEITVGDTKEQLCFVAEGGTCSEMKLCSKGFVCDKDKSVCKLCEENLSPITKTQKGFESILVRGLTCNELKIGVNDT